MQPSSRQPSSKLAAWAACLRNSLLQSSPWGLLAFKAAFLEAVSLEARSVGCWPSRQPSSRQPCGLLAFEAAFLETAFLEARLVGFLPSRQPSSELALWVACLRSSLFGGSLPRNSPCGLLAFGAAFLEAAFLKARLVGCLLSKQTSSRQPSSKLALWVAFFPVGPFVFQKLLKSSVLRIALWETMFCKFFRCAKGDPFKA
jgi:hypothetical protein